MNELNNGIITCDNCGNDVEWYDYELFDDEGDVIKIKYDGWCPHCNKKYNWTSTYHLIEIAYRAV